MSVTYEYYCPYGHVALDFPERGNYTCDMCGSTLKRKWGVSFSMGMKEHFNQSVGQYVSNERALKDELKMASEVASVRTGMTADYQLVDPSDMADASAHGVTTEGLPEQ